MFFFEVLREEIFSYWIGESFPSVLCGAGGCRAMKMSLGLAVRVQA